MNSADIRRHQRAKGQATKRNLDDNLQDLVLEKHLSLKENFGKRETSVEIEAEDNDVMS